MSRSTSFLYVTFRAVDISFATFEFVCPHGWLIRFAFFIDAGKHVDIVGLVCVSFSLPSDLLASALTSLVGLVLDFVLTHACLRSWIVLVVNTVHVGRIATVEVDVGNALGAVYP